MFKSLKHWRHSSSFARNLWIEMIKDFGIPNGILNAKWHRTHFPYRGKEYYVNINKNQWPPNLRHKDKHGKLKGR